MPDKSSKRLRQNEWPPDADHYRELAKELRDVAQGCRFPRERLEIVQLALKFEQRAERIEKSTR